MDDYLFLSLGEHQESCDLRERDASAIVAFWQVFYVLKQKINDFLFILPVEHHEGCDFRERDASAKVALWQVSCSYEHE